MIKKGNRKIRNKGTIAIIGLGYVGLPLACLAAEKGYKVFGIIKNKTRAEMISAGRCPIDDARLKRWLKRVSIEATTDWSAIRKAKTVAVCVPTPIDSLNNPDFGPLVDACSNMARHLKKGQLVIIESTINPGVCEEVVKPILEKSRLKAGRDFSLAHCPERINPGDPKWTVRNIPRVVGGYTPKDRDRAVRFYESIIEAAIRPMQSLKAAEATKVIENSFRDVNIAFVNEVAQSFAKLGIDAVDVINGAKTKPFAFLAHYPSCGVGGHCIPVDPYYLIERAKKSGFDHKFLKLAREINNAMPKYTVDLLVDALNEKGRSVKGTRIGLLGVAYKADIDDTRESPFYVIKSLLEARGARLEVYDPHVPKQSTVDSLEALLKRVEVVILATNHQEFLSLNGRLLKRYGIQVVVDGKNALPKDEIVRAGIAYRGIGH